MPGMKAAMRRFSLPDRDIHGQTVVESPNHLFLVAFASIRSSQMNHLRQGMYSGIRAPRALHLHGTTKIVLSRLPQNAHNCASVLLFLPTAVAGSVVFEGEFPGGHGVSMASARIKRSSRGNMRSRYGFPPSNNGACLAARIPPPDSSPYPAYRLSATSIPL